VLFIRTIIHTPIFLSSVVEVVDVLPNVEVVDGFLSIRHVAAFRRDSQTASCIVHFADDLLERDSVLTFAYVHYVTSLLYIKYMNRTGSID
jgi:hypothetical protein